MEVVEVMVGGRGVDGGGGHYMEEGESGTRRKAFKCKRRRARQRKG